MALPDVDPDPPPTPARVPARFVRDLLGLFESDGEVLEKAILDLLT